jgi:PAS domain S-box-containing protein
MTIPLRVLIVEDSEDDMALLLRALRRGNYELSFERVDTAPAMHAALDRQPWDIIISDYTMPQFSGPAALNLLQQRKIDVPFIIVSGTIGEDMAVAAMKAGANDYIMKSNLTRLVPAIERELREAAGRREHQRAEAERRMAEARFAGVLATAAEAIIVMDESQKIVLFNSSAEQIFGYTASAAIGQPLDLLLPPQSAEGHSPDIRAFADDSTTARKLGSRGLMLVGRRKDGAEFPIDASISKLYQDGQITFTVFVQDVSERKRLESQLLHAQKMESIGRLAGGVAHDFNNLLTAITGYSEFLLEDLDQADPRRDDVVEIKKAADRAATLTRQLLAFSRRQMLAPHVLDLNAVVSNMDKMLQRLIGEDVELITVLDPSLGRIKADPSQIEQVIMNLAVNARDAMPQGGQMTIETANVDLDASNVRQHISLRPGPYVLLTVSDTGCGMDEETQSHIFEPFFTTKDRGKGTGLGLSTVYGIIEQSGGSIWVYSEPGHGATFKAYLPQVAYDIELVDAPVPAVTSPGQFETILLVEDEAPVRTLVRRILEREGYTVLEAQHGAEALLTAERFSGPIHMLLTDVVMPEMSGNVLAQHLMGLRPNIKVLYLSGYTDNVVIRHNLLDADTIFLQKPFAPAALTRKVRAVLDD